MPMQRRCSRKRECENSVAYVITGVFNGKPGLAGACVDCMAALRANDTDAIVTIIAMRSYRDSMTDEELISWSDGLLDEAGY